MAEREPKPRPAPVLDSDSEEFWKATTEGRFLVQRCQDCDRFQYYPRARCARCLGPVECVEASGKGAVYSFTVIHQNFSRAFKHLIPYVVALIDLEEGPRLMTNVVGCEPGDVTIGAPVQVRFESVSDEASIPLFELDR